MVIKKILVTMLAGIGLFFSVALGMSCCYSPAYYKARTRASNDIVKIVGLGGGVSKDDLDAAWQEALKIGGGDSSWKCPVTTDNVIYVPSTLSVGTTQFYGITRWDAIATDNQILLVPTVEIHLAPPYKCHVKQVLVHELLHIVLTRREMTDVTMAKQEAKYADQEAMVRALYPVADMGICGE